MASFKIKELISKQNVENIRYDYRNNLSSSEIYSQLLERSATFRHASVDEHKKVFTYQIDGTMLGILFTCRIDKENKELLNEYDFPFLPDNLKQIDSITVKYCKWLDAEIASKFNFEYVERLKEKYDLPEDFIKHFGDNEPLYKKIVESDISIQPYTKRMLERTVYLTPGIMPKELNDIVSLIQKGIPLARNNDDLLYFIDTIESLPPSHQSEIKEEWNIGKSETINSESLYLVQHEYHLEGPDYDGYYNQNCDIHVDTLFATTDYNLAKEYIETYKEATAYHINYPVAHDELKIVEIPLVKSMDISTHTPSFFGGKKFTPSELSIKQGNKKTYNYDDIEY
jgi:hypothetical protein